MNLERLIGIAEKSRLKHSLDCGNIISYIIENTIFDKENYDDSHYIDSLSVLHQPSDGYVIVDEDGNNISVTSILNHLHTNGGINLEEFKDYRI